VTELNPPEPFWRQERWWAKTGDKDDISRNKLIGRWRAKIDLGDLDKKQYDEELAVWSSLLGQRDWVKVDYGPAAAEYASAGVNAGRAGDDIWLSVSRLWHDYGDELARYTLGLVAMAHARRPVVSGLLVDVIREPARKAIRDKDVRARIVTESRVETAAVARAFLDDPGVYLADDAKAVMHAYIHRLYDFTQKCDDADVADAVSTAIDQLIDEFGEPAPEPSRDLSEATRLEARKLLERELAKKPHLYARHRDDGVIGLAAAKAIEFLARKIDAGKEKVTHAGIIHLTIKQVMADERRREAAAKRRLVSLDAILDDPERPDPTDVLDRTREPNTNHQVEVGIIVDMLRREVAAERYARPNLDGTYTWITDFFEKDLALAILDGRTRLTEEEGVNRVVKLFGENVSVTIALDERAICYDAKQAAKFVESLVASAYRKVAVREDLPGVFASTLEPTPKSHTHRKAKSLAMTKNLLNEAKRTPRVGAQRIEEERS